MKNKLLAGVFFLFLSYFGYGQAITVTLPPNPTICSGEQIVLTAAASGGTAPYSYLWSTGETSSAISVNKALTYTVTVTDQLGRTGSGQVAVTEATKPDAPTAVNESGLICSGSSARLTASAPGGVYQWYDANFQYKFTGPVYNTEVITQNTVFYVSTTVQGCVSAFTPVTVTLVAPPAVNSASVCPGSAATFTATGADSYQWYNAARVLVQSGGTTFITGPLTATTSFYVTGTTNGCVSEKVEARAEVKPATPVPNGGGPYNICTGSKITLTASGVAGAVYEWFEQASGGTALIASPDFTTPVLTQNKVYYVQATLNGCTGQRVAVNVTVSQPPQPPAPVSNGPVCYNTAAQLNVSNVVLGEVYEWFTSNTAGTPFRTGATVTTGALLVNTTFYVRAVNGACVSSMVPITVVVKDEVAAPGITGATLICTGSSTVLTAASASGGVYNWFTSNSATTPVFTGPNFTTPVLTSNRTYYVSTTQDGCTSARTSVTVQIIPVVPAPAASNVTTCLGSSATLTATGSDNYQWYDAATGGNLLSSAQTFITPVLTTNTTYYVQTVANGCASNRRSVTVTVTATPAAPVTTTNGPVCYNTSARLQVTNTGSGTFQWFDSPSSTTILFTGKIFDTPTLTAGTTYYVQEVSGSCISPRAAVTVAVQSQVNAPTASSVTICSGATATLTATAPGGTYRWYDAPTAGTLLRTGSSFTTPALTATTVYYVQTTVSGCISERTAVTVTVTPPVTAPSASPVTICSGSTTTLIASAGSNYQWFTAATGGIPLENGSVYVTPVLTSNRTYYVQSSVNGCTSARTPVTVTVTPLPVAPSFSPVSAICEGSSTSITASGVGPIQWYNAATGGTLLFTGNTFTTPVLVNNTTYWAQTTDGTCISNRASVTVTVNPAENSSFSYDSGTYCLTSPNTSPVRTTMGGTFAATPSGLVINSSTGQINPAVSTPGTYTITYTTAGACPSSSQVSVSIVTTPDATFSYNNSPYCQNDTDPFPTFAAGASAGVFSSTTGLVFRSNITGRIDLKASTPGTYTVTNTINSVCGTVSATATVTVDPRAVVNAGSNQTIAAGAVANLSGSINLSGLGVTWSAPAGAGTFSNPNSLNTTFTPTITAGAITLILTSNDPAGACGPASDQVVITVQPKPVNPTVAGVTICSGEQAALSATAPGGTYRWYDDPTAGTLLGTGPNFVTPALTTNTTYYIQTTVNGITSDRAAVTVTVNTPPAAPVAANPAPVCAGSAVTLTATGTGALNWYDAASGGTLLAGNTNTYNIPGISTTTTFYVESNTGACSSARTPVAVTVNQAPAAPTVANATICYNAIATLTATGPGGVYEWFDAASGGNSLGTGATYTTANLVATTTFYVQTTVTGCTSLRRAVTVVVRPVVAPPSAAPQSTCAGSSVTLTATGGDNYEWFDAATAGNSLGTGPNYTTAPLTANTTFYVQSTVSGCTSERTAVLVTVNPMVLTVTGPSAVCSGTTATFTVSGSTGTYQWYSAATGGTLLSITDTYTTPVLNAATTIYVQTTVGNCISPRTAVSVAVDPAPVVTSAATGAVCSGSPQSYTITATNAAATFTYSRAAVAGVSNPAVTNVAASQITEILVNTTTTERIVEYVITPYLNGCAGTPFRYRVTVLPAPAIESAAEIIACNRASVGYFVNIRPNVTSYFSWSRAAVGGISNAAVSGQESRTIRESLENTTNFPIDVFYTFDYGTATCPGVPFTLKVTVNPPVYITSPQYIEACAGGPVGYGITSNVDGLGATFKWMRTTSLPGQPRQTQYTFSNNINEVLSNTTTGNLDVYYLVVPIFNGCEGAPLDVHIILKPQVSKPVISSNSPVCLDKDVNLFTDFVAGATYRWESGAGFTAETDVPFISIPATTNGRVAYRVTVTVNGCANVSDDIFVEINQKPVAVAGADQVFCPQETSVPLNGQVNGGLTGGPIAGRWAIVTGSGTFADAVNEKINAYIPSAADKAPGAPPVVLSLTSASPDDCEPAISLITFTFQPVKAANAGGNRDACEQRFQLNGQITAAGGTGRWSGGDGTFVSGRTALNGMYIPSDAERAAGRVVLTLIADNVNACDDPNDEAVITLLPPPTVSADARPVRYVIKDKTITLNPVVSDANVTYSWWPTTGLSNPNVKNPVVTGIEDITYTLTVTNSLQCSSQADVMVRVAPQLSVVNTFTPNADGVNDHWFITGAEAYPQMVVDIYTRSGQLIYHSVGYSTPWDGTSNGKPVPFGVYYFVIDTKETGQKLSGYVTVVR